MKIKSWISFLRRWPHTWICLIALITLILHFCMITRPATYIADEGYYVADAKSIIAHQGTITPEHPPLGKLFIVSGIRILGDNPWGWRFFSVIFGTISIILLYLICRRLKLKNNVVLIATGLFAFENLSFIQASIAMLDVYCLTFMLAALLFFLSRKYFWAGIFAAFSILSKLNGVSILGVFFLYWLFTERKNWRMVVIPIVTASVSFLALLPILDYGLFFKIVNPFQLIQYLLHGMSSNTFSHVALRLNGSLPWDWLMNGGAIIYHAAPQYIAILSFSISIFIIPCILYLIYKSIKSDRRALLALTWFACNFLPWIAISLFFNRTTYIYYMYPVIIAFSIGISQGLGELSDYWNKNRPDKIASLKRLSIPVYLVLHVIVFAALSPLAPPLINWIVR